MISAGLISASLISADMEALRDAELTTFCSLVVQSRLFGIDTAGVREVLGWRTVERVPLAPGYIGGIVPYRGDVLTAVCLRALLGLAPPAPGAAGGCVLVIEDEAAIREGHGQGSERFGLMVDAVGSVVTVDRRRISANPSTLDEAGKALFLGAVRTPAGLLVQLDPRRLNPARLASVAVFAAMAGGRAKSV